MFRDNARAEAKLPPCAACGELTAHVEFWVGELCDKCHVRFLVETPPDSVLELAHADAHPEDVELRFELQFPAVGQEPRQVLLKPGVSARVLETNAKAWISKQHKARAA